MWNGYGELVYRTSAAIVLGRVIYSKFIQILKEVCFGPTFGSYKMQPPCDCRLIYHPNSYFAWVFDPNCFDLSFVGVSKLDLGPVPWLSSRVITFIFLTLLSFATFRLPLDTTRNILFGAPTQKTQIPER